MVVYTEQDRIPQTVFVLHVIMDHFHHALVILSIPRMSLQHVFTLLKVRRLISRHFSRPDQNCSVYEITHSLVLFGPAAVNSEWL